MRTACRPPGGGPGRNTRRPSARSSSPRPSDSTRARSLTHAPRGADAVHLTSALAIRDPGLVLAVRDRRPHVSATAAGLRAAPAHPGSDQAPVRNDPQTARSASHAKAAMRGSLSLRDAIHVAPSRLICALHGVAGTADVSLTCRCECVAHMHIYVLPHILAPA
jgi:hypothetical protein